MISIHFIVDNADPKHLDRGLLYLKRTKQRRTNIAAGSQLDRGMQFVERVKAEMPGIEVTWRHMKPEDTGISSQMTAQELYNLKVAPFRDWLKKYQIVFMPDNESSGDDNRIRAYAQWQADFGKLLHAVGLRGAFCRFATGNIRESQYVLLKPVFDMMLPGDYISPNEYSNAPGKSSGGHLERYKHLWAAAGRTLPTTIGEAGIAVDYDPGKGWLAVPGLSGAAYAQQMIDEEVWYEDGAIDRFPYCIGGHTWPSFQLVQNLHNGEVQSDTLDYLENYYARQGMPPDLTPGLPATPPSSPVPRPIVALPADRSNSVMFTVEQPGWRLRREPNESGEQVGMLRVGEKVRAYRQPSVPNGGRNWHCFERITPDIPANEADAGWSAYPLPLPTPPVEPPAPEPIPTPVPDEPEEQQPVETPTPAPEPSISKLFAQRMAALLTEQAKMWTDLAESL